MPTPEDDLRDMQDTLDKEKERLHLIRMQLAKKNRAIFSIERKLDNIPDRTELAQYQQRFIELYSQGMGRATVCDHAGLALPIDTPNTVCSSSRSFHVI